MGLKTHHPSDSTLKVITYANDLMSYVLKVTQNSPKQYRFTFVTRLQNLTMDVVELLLLANDVYVTKANIDKTAEQRIAYQHQALSKLRALGYFSLEAQKYQAIQMKHAIQINKQGVNCIQFLQLWIKSDRERYRKIYSAMRSE
ncbi:MAG: four helix bundle protein [Streptococcaceae bacterium]|nr:four helix bundle protein [Streptococcaceae bacterium]